MKKDMDKKLQICEVKDVILLQELPEHILREIFMYLTPGDRHCLSQVSCALSHIFSTLTAWEINCSRRKYNLIKFSSAAIPCVRSVRVRDPNVGELFILTKKHPEVKSLSIHYTSPGVFLQIELIYCQYLHLETLRIRRRLIRPSVYLPAVLTNLKVLDLSLCILHLDVLNQICLCASNLDTLVLDHVETEYEFNESHNIPRTASNKLCSFKQTLQQLSLVNTQVEFVRILFISQLTNLKVLNLADNCLHLTWEFSSVYQKNKSVRKLDLSRCHLSQGLLQFCFSFFPNLQHLCLTGVLITHISDLAKVQMCYPSLRRIELGNTGVTDDGLSLIVKLFPSLEFMVVPKSTSQTMINFLHALGIEILIFEQ